MTVKKSEARCGSCEYWGRKHEVMSCTNPESPKYNKQTFRHSGCKCFNNQVHNRT